MLQKKHALQQLSNPSQLSQQQSGSFSTFLSFFCKVVLESDDSVLFSMIGWNESDMFNNIKLYIIIYYF
jgi:hypothetical protein